MTKFSLLVELSLKRTSLKVLELLHSSASCEWNYNPALWHSKAIEISSAELFGNSMIKKMQFRAVESELKF